VARPRAPAAVLIVEDESIVAHDIGQTLTDLGYEVCGRASSAEEALARATERPPDVALVDIRIKGKLDGTKAAQLLQERFGTAIVYVTAHADDKTVERAARTRPLGYLVKPVRPAELKRTIELALVRHRTEGEEPHGGSASSTAESARSTSGDVVSPDAQAVRRHLEELLPSPDFDAAPRSRKFLRFVVEEALAGRGEALTQAAIATQVFDRRGDFDPVVDPIVRIQAGRLRRSLERYYLLAGKGDSLRIVLPKGSYVPVFSTSPPQGGAPPVEKRRPTAGAATVDWPSVVVRSFEGVFSGPEQEREANRLKELLAVELGRYRDARVVLDRAEEGLDPDRREPARFEIRGSLQREDEGWLVTARLADRAAGEQLWSDEYHTTPGPGLGSLDDAARVVAARVGAEHGVIVQALWAQYRGRISIAGGTYGAIVRAYHFLFTREIQELAPAIEGLRKAVRDEPEAALAWTFLARLYHVNHSLELSDLQTPLDDSISYAYQAIRLDPTAVRSRTVLAASLLFKGELLAGRNELEQALRLNPGSLVYLEMMGWLLALLGDWERGMSIVRDAMKRNPHHLPHAYHGLWADHLRRGEFEEAYAAALEYRDPSFFWRSMMRACCLGHLGRAAEARAMVEELRKEKPAIEERGRTLIGYYIKPPELRERVFEGLRKAGLKLR
jgi:adenylate cyclase